MYDRKEADTSTCLNVTFWRFDDVQVDNIVGNVASSTRPTGNIKHTTIFASPLQDDPDFQVKVSISYDLKVRLFCYVVVVVEVEADVCVYVCVCVCLCLCVC